jgi:hypothetical protein
MFNFLQVLAMLERFHLIIIREVKRQGSLTAAAEVLHLTQSALSHTVKKIEQQLGTPIWDREGISKQIFLGTREADASIDYLHAFVELAQFEPWRGACETVTWARDLGRAV